MINSFRDLIVWQKSMDLVKQVYTVTKTYPKEEKYGLVDQSNRAAVAIPSNIAEGYQRRHLGEYVQFLSIAYGSSAEIETQLLLAVSLKYVRDNDLKDTFCLLNEVQKMLNVLIIKLRNSSPKA